MEQMRKKIESKKKNVKILDSDEQFSYIMVKNEFCYKEDGTKSTRKYDYMEYASITKEQNMEVDIGYYLKQTVGMCARFINEDDSFQPSPSDKIMQIKDSDEREK